MTSKVSFVTVDVFTEERFRGNQLAIVNLPTLSHLTKSRKQQIAREFNFSETVFLSQHPNTGTAPSPPTWAAEIFTPEAEMAFAGHPVIGTGHYLFSRTLGLPPFSPTTTTTTTAEADDDDEASKPAAGNELTLHTASGPVTLHRTPSTALVRAAIPHAVRVHGARAAWTQLLPTQPALAAAAPALPPGPFPTVSIVRGVAYVLVDLSAHASAFAAVAAGPSPAGVELDEGWGRAPSFVGVMYYRVLEGAGGGEAAVRLRVRMVAIGLEDPACGSGSAALCAYLALRRGGAGARCRFELEQGAEIGRQSYLNVEVVLCERGQEVKEVWLAGKAAYVTQGEFFGV